MRNEGICACVFSLFDQGECGCFVCYVTLSWFVYLWRFAWLLGESCVQHYLLLSFYFTSFTTYEPDQAGQDGWLERRLRLRRECLNVVDVQKKQRGDC